MFIMNTEIKEIHIVFLAILILILVNIFMKQVNSSSEGFAAEFNTFYPRNYGYEYRYPYDWYYWLYYINPWYPPRRVDLPFAGRNGKTSWYKPYEGTVYNY